MSIGATIKKLRREKNITQEQLAEYLGITSRAVSQWECDRTMPDITQLPLLANIFEVGTDVLLGVDIEKNEQKIRESLAMAEEAAHSGAFGKAVEILRAAYSRFPRSYAIMERLANALVCVYSRKGIREYDDVIRLCDRILSECTDSMLRYKALELLGLAYGYAGKRDAMLQLAEQMPPFRFSQERFMLWEWSLVGKEGVTQRQTYLTALLEQVLSALTLIAGHRNDDGTPVYSPQDKIALWKQIVYIIELLCPDGDYQILAQHAESACCDLAAEFCRAGDIENALYWLEKAADYAIHMDTYGFGAPHTSPALRGYSSGGWIPEGGKKHTSDLLDWMMEAQPVCKMQKDARFQAIVSRARTVAKTT